MPSLHTFLKINCVINLFCSSTFKIASTPISYNIVQLINKDASEFCETKVSEIASANNSIQHKSYVICI